jgi:hypothetical protein
MKFAVCIRNCQINHRNLQSSVRFVSTSNITLSLSKNVDVDKGNDENVKISIEDKKRALFKTTKAVDMDPNIPIEDVSLSRGIFLNKFNKVSSIISTANNCIIFRIF